MPILTKPQSEDIQYMDSLCTYVLSETYMSYSFRILLVKHLEKKIRALLKYHWKTNIDYADKWSLVTEESVAEYDAYVYSRRGGYSAEEILDRQKKIWDVINFNTCYYG